MSLEKALQRAFDRANLIGIDADLDAIMQGYKVFREMHYSDEKQYEECYSYLAKKLGF